MSDHIENLADRLSEAFGEPTLIPQTVKALLWDIDAEAWERGVMFKGGIGTLRPERPLNPYLHRCNAPLNIKGEGFNCDRMWGHARPHGNTAAGAIWDDEQPPESVEPTEAHA